MNVVLRADVNHCEICMCVCVELKAKIGLTNRISLARASIYN